LTAELMNSKSKTFRK